MGRFIFKRLMDVKIEEQYEVKTDMLNWPPMDCMWPSRCILEDHDSSSLQKTVWLFIMIIHVSTM
jgi:hypothetical protein